MKTDYKTELGKSYMVLGCEEKEDAFAVQMLEENHIRSLLPYERRCFNGELQFFYDVTGMCALASRIEKTPLGAKDVRRLLQGLYCVFEEIHSYFLASDGLLLQAKYIYEISNEVLFCYYPSKEADGLGATVETFAEELLDQINNEEEEALQLAYHFYSLVRDAKKGILYILEEVLTEENEVLQPQQNPTYEPAVPTEKTEKEEITARKPDAYTTGCFLLSFLVCFCCFFILPAYSTHNLGMRPAAGIIMVLSIAGMATGLTDIDIVRKK